MVIIIPLLFNPLGCFAFEVDKIFLFRFGVGVLLILWLLSKKRIQDVFMNIWDRMLLLRLVDIDFLLVGLLFAYGIATVFSIAPEDSFWGLPDRNWGMITIISFFILYWLCSGVFRHKSDVEKLIKAIAVTSVLICLYAIMQKMGLDLFGLGQGETLPSARQVVRVSSTLGHPNYLGAWLAMTLPWLFGGLFLIKKITIRLFISVAILLNLAALYCTFNRGGWLAAICGLLSFVILILLFRGCATWLSSRAFRINIVGLFCAILVIVSFFFGVWGFGGDLRAKEFDIDGGSIYIRLQDYKFAWQKIKERPLFGWGAETFGYLSANREYTNKELAINDQLADRAHNFFLDILVNLGIVGLFFWCAVFLRIFYLAWYTLKNSSDFLKKIIMIFAASSLVAYCIEVQFHFDTVATSLFVFINFCLINSFAANQEATGTVTEAVARPRQMSSVLWIFVLAIFLLNVYINIGAIVWNFTCA